MAILSFHAGENGGDGFEPTTYQRAAMNSGITANKVLQYDAAISQNALNLNLFDVTKITDNASITNNGTIKESSGWALSDFIKLKANTTYYSFGFYLETFFAVYTLDKVVTSASKVTLQYVGTNKVLGTITVGSEDVLVRMSWLKSNSNPYISQYINAYRPFGTSDYSFVSPYLLKSNSIANKKVAIIGDSISAYNYAYYNKWTQALQNEGFLPQDLTNSSIHATGFVTDGSYAGGTRTGDNFPTRLQAIETPNIYDYVIIFGGVNDYIQAVPIADFTTAVNDFFEYLVKNFINASIMVVLPLYRAYHGANAIDKTEDDYIAIIKNAAKTYHLPILNATDESGFYADVDEFKTRWTNQGDGLHPNEEWSRTRLAPYIRAFIESHLKY